MLINHHDQQPRGGIEGGIEGGGAGITDVGPGNLFFQGEREKSRLASVVKKKKKKKRPCVAAGDSQVCVCVCWRTLPSLDVIHQGALK